jgi:hypothetical protein
MDMDTTYAATLVALLVFVASTMSQFSILVGVVITTAIIPTFIAQRWFSPALSEQDQQEVLAQEEESL